jgi:hypothetical protein
MVEKSEMEISLWKIEALRKIKVTSKNQAEVGELGAGFLSLMISVIFCILWYSQTAMNTPERMQHQK